MGGMGCYHVDMPFKPNQLTTNPRDISVQVQFRCPFWYREQLAMLAASRGISLSELVVNIVEDAVEPKRIAR
jgi:hypothetical protein